ncbi:hypothetical protein NL676_015825 [Syzygium grande]|nr:hypothetical protein NL676_015825 [Syzygium grande]
MLHLLLPLLLLISNVGRSQSAIVESLPAFPGDLPFKLETGYVGVGELEELQLVYYFIESERSQKDDPLLLWLTGGPGCSVLSGLLFEIDSPPPPPPPTSSHIVHDRQSTTKPDHRTQAPPAKPPPPLAWHLMASSEAGLRRSSPNLGSRVVQVLDLQILGSLDAESRLIGLAMAEERRRAHGPELWTMGEVRWWSLMEFGFGVAGDGGVERRCGGGKAKESEERRASVSHNCEDKIGKSKQAKRGENPSIYPKFSTAGSWTRAVDDGGGGSSLSYSLRLEVLLVKTLKWKVRWWSLMEFGFGVAGDGGVERRCGGGKAKESEERRVCHTIVKTK